MHPTQHLATCFLYVFKKNNLPPVSPHEKQFKKKIINILLNLVATLLYPIFYYYTWLYSDLIPILAQNKLVWQSLEAKKWQNHDPPTANAFETSIQKKNAYLPDITESTNP